MAEAFAIASGALSVAGVAGQLLEGTRNLIAIYRDMKDAPQYLTRLTLTIEIVKQIAEAAHQIHDQIPGTLQECMQKALDHCSNRINSVQDLVSSVRTSKLFGPLKPGWTRLAVTANMHSFQKLCRELEEAKSTLHITFSQASLHIQLEMNKAQDRTIDHIDSGFSALHQSVSTAQWTMVTSVGQVLESSTVASNSDVLSSEAFPELPQNIPEDNVYQAQLSALLSSHFKSLYVKADKFPDQQWQHQCLGVETLIQEALNILPKLPPAIAILRTQFLQELFIEHMTETDSGGLECFSRLGYQKPVLTGNASTFEASELHQVTEPEKAYESGLHRTNAKVRERATKTICDSKVFGKVLIFTKSRILSVGDVTPDGEVEEHHGGPGSATIWMVESSRVMTTIKLLPQNGVVTGSVASAVWEAYKAQRPSFTLQTLRPVQLVAVDSPIFQAIGRRDLDAVRDLFARGLASPYDESPEGMSLVGRIIADEDSLVDVPDRVDETLSESLAKHELLRFLATHGVSPDDIYRFRTSREGKVYFPNSICNVEASPSIIQLYHDCKRTLGSEPIDILDAIADTVDWSTIDADVVARVIFGIFLVRTALEYDIRESCLMRNLIAIRPIDCYFGVLTISIDTCLAFDHLDLECYLKLGSEILDWPLLEFSLQRAVFGLQQVIPVLFRCLAANFEKISVHQTPRLWVLTLAQGLLVQATAVLISVTPQSYSLRSELETMTKTAVAHNFLHLWYQVLRSNGSELRDDVVAETKRIQAAMGEGNWCRPNLEAPLKREAGGLLLNLTREYQALLADIEPKHCNEDMRFVATISAAASV